MQHSTAWRVISCKNTFLLPHMLLPVLTDFFVFFCSLLLPSGHIPEMLFSLLFSRSGVLRKKPASGLIFLPFFHLLLFFTIYSFRIVRVAVFFSAAKPQVCSPAPRAGRQCVSTICRIFLGFVFFAKTKAPHLVM